MFLIELVGCINHFGAHSKEVQDFGEEVYT